MTALLSSIDGAWARGLVLGLLSLAVPATAAASPCADATTPAQMERCLSRDLEEQTQALEEAMTQLRDRLDSNAVEVLDRSHETWVAYRDAECARQADSVRGGPLMRTLELTCKVALTGERLDIISVELTPP